MLGRIKVYHNRETWNWKIVKMTTSDKQSLAKQLNLVQNLRSATGDPLKPEKIYQNCQSLELRAGVHSNFL